MRIRDALLGVIFACLGIFMMIEASGFPSFPGQPYGASLLPGLLGGGFVISGLLLVGRDLASGGFGAGGRWIVPVPALATRQGAVSALLIVGTVLAHVIVSPWLGFIPVSVICLAGLFLWFGVRPGPALLIAALGTAVCWVFFAMLLKVPLPRGLLEGLV